MSTLIEPISIDESKRLTQLETQIEKGFATFMEVGAALQEIYDKRLYRDDYSSFKGYCDKKWNLSSRHAYRLMFAAEVADGLPGPKPKHESQVRPLSNLPPEERADAYEEAVADAGGEAPTHDIVERVVGSRTKTRPTGHTFEQKADNAGVKRIGFDVEEIEKDRELKSALTTLKRVCGEDFSRAIILGTVPFSRKDVLALADKDVEEMKGLAALILDRRWTLNRATGFVNTMVDEDTNVQGLILHAIASGGTLEADIKGWRITVNQVRINGHKH